MHLGMFVIGGSETIAALSKHICTRKVPFCARASVSIVTVRSSRLPETFPDQDQRKRRTCAPLILLRVRTRIGSRPPVATGRFGGP